MEQRRPWEAAAAHPSPFTSDQPDGGLRQHDGAHPLVRRPLGVLLPTAACLMMAVPLASLNPALLREIDPGTSLQRRGLPGYDASHPVLAWSWCAPICQRRWRWSSLARPRFQRPRQERCSIHADVSSGRCVVA